MICWWLEDTFLFALDGFYQIDDFFTQVIVNPKFFCLVTHIHTLVSLLHFKRRSLVPNCCAHAWLFHFVRFACIIQLWPYENTIIGWFHFMSSVRIIHTAFSHLWPEFPFITSEWSKAKRHQLLYILIKWRFNTRSTILKDFS